LHPGSLSPFLLMGWATTRPAGMPLVAVPYPLSPGVEMAKFRRTDRINEQLREEISLLVRDEVRDPRVSLATITAVKTSPELDHAKVYFTSMGSEEERDDTLTGLRSAAAFLRRELGKRLHMRRIPELHFELDRVLEEASRIEQLLREVRPSEDGAGAGEEKDAE
jgi:ribosome-binding factor A